MAQSPKCDQESWGVELALTWRQVDLQSMNISVATACILHQICAANDKQSQYHPRTAPFVGLEIPDIGVVDYCKRLRKYFNCSPSCFVTALMYIDTILTKTKKLSPEHRVVLDTLTIHRLTLVALVLAVKYHEDNHYSQAYYAQVGGVSLSELNAIERKFVAILEWDLDVNYDRFAKYFGELVCHPTVCKECQLDTAPMETKQPELPPTPKKSPKAASSKSSKSSQVKSVFGKWTSTLSQNIAATKSIFASQGMDETDRSVSGKKKPGRQEDAMAVEKENMSPGEPRETTTNVYDQYEALSLEETNGPEPQQTPHWHDTVGMLLSQNVLVSAV
jgi:hypothetical protein